MSKHDFGYFFHEGLSNMFSHGFMSFAAIGITVACLLIMGTFTLVAVNADANLKQAELLGAAFTLAAGGPAQPHVGTGAGSSSSDLPWGEQKNRSKRSK